MMWTGVILIAIDLASFLSLSSHDRVSSFYWTRGSKLCFLARFSYFSCYFLILVFLQKNYLLVSLRLSRMNRNPISHPIFSYPWNSEVVCHMCASMFLAQNTWIEARCSREPVSRLTTGFLSHLSLSPKVSHANIHWVIAYHTFSYL
jgi:hypothetical protein